MDVSKIDTHFKTSILEKVKARTYKNYAKYIDTIKSKTDSASIHVSLS